MIYKLKEFLKYNYEQSKINAELYKKYFEEITSKIALKMINHLEK